MDTKWSGIRQDQCLFVAAKQVSRTSALNSYASAAHWPAQISSMDQCIKSSTLPLQADIACNQAHYARSGGSVRRFAELINAEVMREKMSSKKMEGHTLSYCKAAPSPQLRRMASLARSMLSPEVTWKMNARLQWPHLL